MIDVIRSGNMMKANIVDMAKMSYGEQLKVCRERNYNPSHINFSFLNR